MYEQHQVLLNWPIFAQSQWVRPPQAATSLS